jgi:hypothetical protein
MDEDLILAALADLDDDELDALDEMTRQPDLWPVQHRDALPGVRDRIDVLRTRDRRPCGHAMHDDCWHPMSTSEIERRIGATS